ncbi:MAG: hypothetical protein DI538_21910 [Azospira oryzae]|nr:hypothetical protein [Cytophaga sp.]PZR30871.1 MAG: hypothetical protein DI538_21910 [Azospira oryzae]
MRLKFGLNVRGNSFKYSLPQTFDYAANIALLQPNFNFTASTILHHTPFYTYIKNTSPYYNSAFLIILKAF